MLRRLILTLTLAFLFGIGQQGALVHQLSHVDDLASSSQQQDKSAHSVCDKCLSYSALAHALGVQAFQHFQPANSFTLHAHAQAHHTSLAPPFYRARAPPQFI
jgi:hypothetical protein